MAAKSSKTHRIVIEDRSTLLRVKLYCGCSVVLEGMMLYAQKHPAATFRTSAISTCSVEEAARSIDLRLPHQQELAERAAQEYARHAGEVYQH